ncbi:YhgE/Pip domain-containing protein [Latilactobacillus sakei]|uniref:Chromosome partition protein Smc n=3 Tax=Latilactobacillus sakei TaxID=1599 RepID=A0AAE8LX23_LATSK|nr:YhgE/Pip domain-containing protein [Latilactobacillus sakei]AST84330.1 ABC transporter [Latilactobacillus sakei]AWZ42278.1 YhgE/Pip domain-containing protein [Latilactobacillus sakei]AWZ46552.1 YhgE/Pip domain-containing protein [Latilactobacillus sakei]USS38605.1 YhgE/Pip family protein [Latilactobacillus sakei]SPE23338.1 Chromosome partition protein Smc [Latilactobacillus sakei]
MKMIQNEFKFIAKNKIIMISLIAIVFIPFLYSVFFLKSVWDPYGSTGELPVAVVNNDQPATYNGETLSAGKDMVKELKKNDQLGWRFVSAKKAKQGLKDKEYYTVVTLPKNFSANAATVLDKNPKKMQIQYETNDSLNFIGEVISEMGAKELNAQVRETVTKAYAQVMFKQVKTAGKGFSTAASGAKKLTKGSVTLSDGLNTYTAGVDKVNDGVMTMKTSVTPLSDGIQKLAAGSGALNTGLQTLNSKTGALASGASQLDSGANQLNTGLQTLNSKTGALASGASQLNNGAGQLNTGVQQYTAGASDLQSGLKKITANNNDLNGGIKQLASKTQQLPSGAAGVYVLNSVVSQNLGVVDSQLKTQSENMAQFATMPTHMASVNKESKELATLLEELKPSMALLVQLNTVYKENATQLAQLGQLGTQLKGFETTLTNSATTIGQNSGATLADLKVISAEASKLSPEAQKALGDIQTKSMSNIASVKAIQTASSQLNIDQLTGMVDQLTPLLGQMGNLDDSINKLNTLSANAEKLLTESDGLTNAKMQGEIRNLVGQMTALSNGISLLNETATQSTSVAAALNSGVNGENNTPQINGIAISQSKDPKASIEKQVAAIAKESEMTPKINQLSAGISAYTAGVSTAKEGADTLTANNGQLVSGSSQLAAGTKQLNGQVPQLTSGVGQLAAGSKQLATGTGQLNSQVPQLTSGVSQLATGSETLNGGLGQLNAKIPTLTSGVGQLADGTSQLAANSAKLNDGAGQLTDGNKTLATALKGGAKQVNDIQLTNKTADMFAAPAELKHSNYSYVPNYGHALAPYVLSLALFVGAIVFNFAFPIRKVSMTGQSATAWYLSKISVGALVAVGMAIIEPGLMMIAGLNVDHPAQFFLVSIMFSLTSMAIIMFLSMTFDNPGRFLAMVLLMLQLGGSGGTFPMEITNHFYNVIHPFLPMTYSILGFRQAITSGLGNGQVLQTVFTLLLFMVVALILLWFGMNHLQKIGNGGRSVLDDNQKLQDLEK